MMTSYFNLLKYAATGIASPDMTYYDKMRASTLMCGAVQTLTGIPPLSFKSDGSPLISWSMKGNGSQTGTPTPDNPVMPTFCGVRTANLFYSDRTKQNTTAYSTIDQTEGSSDLVITKYETSSTVALSVTINLPLRAGTYTVSITGLSVIGGNIDRINLRDSGGVVVNNIMTGSPQSFTIAEDTVINAVVFVCDSTSTYTNKKIRIMLNSGSTALPYEPFGYKIPITCAGQTVPVYLGQTQTVRRVGKLVLTGTSVDGNTNITAQGVIYITPTATLKNIGAAYCTHFKYVNQGQGSSMPSNSFTTSGGAGTSLWFKTDYTTVADFKAYLAAQYAAGHPVTVWYVLATPETGIVNEPLCKIGDYADELHSTDAAVTIPTVRGQNVLTVDTPIQPSEMSITYRG